MYNQTDKERQIKQVKNQQYNLFNTYINLIFNAHVLLC